MGACHEQLRQGERSQHTLRCHLVHQLPDIRYQDSLLDVQRHRCCSLLCVVPQPPLQVAKVVAPKKAKLAEAEAAYQEVMVGLTAKQQELQVCNNANSKHLQTASALCAGVATSLLCLQGLLDKLASMESDLKSQQRKKEQLEADIELCSIKLDRAEKLIGGLGGEKARWEEAALELAKAQVRVTQGDDSCSAHTAARLFGPGPPSFLQHGDYTLTLSAPAASQVPLGCVAKLERSYSCMPAAVFDRSI